MAGDTREDPIIIPDFEHLIHPTVFSGDHTYYKYGGKEKEIDLNDLQKTSSTNNQNAVIYTGNSSVNGYSMYIDFDGLTIKNLTLNENDPNLYQYFFKMNDSNDSNGSKVLTIENLIVKDVYLQGKNSSIFEVTSNGQVHLHRVAVSALLEGGYVTHGYNVSGYQLDQIDECSFNFEVLNLKNRNDSEPILNGPLQNSRVSMILNLSRLTEGIASNSYILPALLPHVNFNNIVDISLICPDEPTSAIKKNYTIKLFERSTNSKLGTPTNNICILRFENLNTLTIGDTHDLTIQVPKMNGSLIACQGTNSDNNRIKLIESGEVGSTQSLVYIPYTDLQNPKRLRELGFPIGVDS